jgi:hypothetical protein
MRGSAVSVLSDEVYTAHDRVKFAACFDLIDRRAREIASRLDAFCAFVALDS